LRELPRERVDRPHEWRDAFLVGADQEGAVEVGLVPPGGVLRLAVLPIAEDGDKIGAVEIFADETPVAKEELSQDWTDIRVDLSEYADAICRVVVRGGRGYALAQCELIAPTQDTSNVLIILVDTLRNDHLGCYGYERDTSPNIDSLADDGVLFTNLVPQSSWTRPSVASLLTSTYPGAHGAEDRADVLREGLPSLAKSLAAAGYETHGFMTNPNCLPDFGFGKDFSRFKDVDSRDWQIVNDRSVVDAAVATIRHSAGRPWFMYLHTMGPHHPFNPPAPYDTRFLSPAAADDPRVKSIDLYDGEIAHTDAQLGRVFDELKQSGIYDNTLIIFVSDHGEVFYENGESEHGMNLSEDLLDVPFIMKRPGEAAAGTKREALVEMVDIAPTVLRVLGLPSESAFRGADLFDSLDDGAEERLAYASLKLEDNSMRMARDMSWKFVQDVVGETRHWYDLTKDPLGAHPADVAPDAADHLESHLTRMGMESEQGFHMLVTGTLKNTFTISGTIAASGLTSARLQYPSRDASIAVKNGVATLDLPLRGRDTFFVRGDSFVMLKKGEAAAHITAEFPLEESVSIDLRIDGRPVPEEVVIAGAARTHVRVDGTPLDPWDLVALPNAFDADALPEDFAIYIWYVLPPERLETEMLDPSMREALEGLGYL
jgi:arylsulfatase A-like enzyme